MRSIWRIQPNEDYKIGYPVLKVIADKCNFTFQPEKNNNEPVTWIVQLGSLNGNARNTLIKLIIHVSNAGGQLIVITSIEYDDFIKAIALTQHYEVKKIRRRADELFGYINSAENNHIEDTKAIRASQQTPATPASIQRVLELWKKLNLKKDSLFISKITIYYEVIINRDGSLDVSKLSEEHLKGLANDIEFRELVGKLTIPPENYCVGLDTFKPKTPLQQQWLKDAMRVLAHASASKPVGMVLSGEAGIGKTHLALAVAKECMSIGMHPIYVSQKNLIGSVDTYINNLISKTPEGKKVIWILDDCNSPYDSFGLIFKQLIKIASDRRDVLLVTSNTSYQTLINAYFSCDPSEAVKMKRLADELFGFLWPLEKKSLPVGFELTDISHIVFPKKIRFFFGEVGFQGASFGNTSALIAIISNFISRLPNPSTIILEIICPNKASEKMVFTIMPPHIAFDSRINIIVLNGDSPLLDLCDLTYIVNDSQSESPTNQTEQHLRSKLIINLTPYNWNGAARFIYTPDSFYTLPENGLITKPWEEPCRDDLYPQLTQLFSYENVLVIPTYTSWLNESPRKLGVFTVDEISRDPLCKAIQNFLNENNKKIATPWTAVYICLGYKPEDAHKSSFDDLFNEIKSNHVAQPDDAESVIVLKLFLGRTPQRFYHRLFLESPLPLIFEGSNTMQEVNNYNAQAGTPKPWLHGGDTRSFSEIPVFSTDDASLQKYHDLHRLACSELEDTYGGGTEKGKKALCEFFQLCLKKDDELLRYFKEYAQYLIAENPCLVATSLKALVSIGALGISPSPVDGAFIMPSHGTSTSAGGGGPAKLPIQENPHGINRERSRTLPNGQEIRVYTSALFRRSQAMSSPTDASTWASGSSSPFFKPPKRKGPTNDTVVIPPKNNRS